MLLVSVGLTQPTYTAYGDDQPSVKAQVVNLIYAVQTVMRGTFASHYYFN